MDEKGQRVSGLFHNPKVVFGFILFLTVFAFGLAAFRVANGIKGGFVPARSNANAAGEVSDPYALDSERDEALKSKDTDGDGLNDYEELYTYRTSAYLKDTDSDGKEDKEEIDAEKDPNCPEGQSCKQFAPRTDQDSETSEPQGREGNLFEELLNASGEGSDGMTDEQLPASPDARLDSAKRASQGGPMTNNEEKSSGESEGGGGASGGADAGAELNLHDLTVEEVRRLLLESGKMTKEQLDQIDDETLMSAYEEIVTSNL